jgi:3-hydroxyisobutyrate dehydrogenase-like beta-hydroxyacid dehydrogenase
MARNLQLRLHAGGDQAVRRSLLLYNRSPDKAAPLLADSSLGCSLAGSLADVAQCCSIICLMLIDDDACEAVLTQLLAAPGGLQGKVVVNHSTSSPDWTRRAAARAEAQGASYVAAPVWGRCGSGASAGPRKQGWQVWDWAQTHRSHRTRNGPRCAALLAGLTRRQRPA